MTFHDGLVVCLAWGCLLATAWVSPAAAQIRALPPIVADTGQPCSTGNSPDRPPDGATPISGLAMSSSPPLASAVGWGQPAACDIPELLPPQMPQNAYSGQQPLASGYWTWQVLPDGLIYRSYLAAGRESRFASHWIHERDLGWLWDISLGGRVGLLRYGTQNNNWPEGWQLDVEGAAFPRLAMERDRDLVSADFRVGFPLTVRRDRWEGKFSYYHLSSHLGDEFLETFSATRINYVRDALVVGIAFRPNSDVRLYSEAGWAFYTGGGSRPWEFQFGVDYSPAAQLGAFPAPFFAVNGRLRQEVDFGGNFTVQTGCQWRGQSGNLVRFGMHYLNGKTDQYQFLPHHEEQIGLGVWYDY